MRMLDCDCGAMLKAANDDDLTDEVLAHVEEQHEDMEFSEEQARKLVSERAYDAADS